MGISQEFKEFLEQPREKQDPNKYVELMVKNNLQRIVENLQYVEFVTKSGNGYIIPAHGNIDKKSNGLNILEMYGTTEEEANNSRINFNSYLEHLKSSDNPKASPSFNSLKVNPELFTSVLNSPTDNFYDLEKKILIEKRQKILSTLKSEYKIKEKYKLPVIDISSKYTLYSSNSQTQEAISISLSNKLDSVVVVQPVSNTEIQSSFIIANDNPKKDEILSQYPDAEILGEFSGASLSKRLVKIKNLLPDYSTFNPSEDSLNGFKQMLLDAHNQTKHEPDPNTSRHKKVMEHINIEPYFDIDAEKSLNDKLKKMLKNKKKDGYTPS